MPEELFIVEGKAASNALLAAIDSPSQRVHALQGKLANVRTMSDDAVAANVECQKLNNALQSQPDAHVLVLMDPNVDGAHSCALLLSFLSRYFLPMVEQGLLSVIEPPLFRVSAKGCKPEYAWSDEELSDIQEQRGDASLWTMRFQGIAQFSADECHQLLLDPDTRRQYRLKP